MIQTELFTEPELARVSGNIAGAILCFYEQRLKTNPTFHAEELREFVRNKTQIAPASADRVLRELRTTGRLNYRIVNRRGSLYEFVSLGRPCCGSAGRGQVR